MDNILGGYIINSMFHENLIIEEKVEFEIHIETHHISIQFSSDLYTENNNHPIDYIFLIDAHGKRITVLDCYIQEQSMRRVKILFSTIILGAHNQQLSALRPTSVCFEIGSDPVPLLNFHLPTGSNVLENVKIDLQKSKNNLTNVNLTIEPTKESLSLDDLETVFFNIMDICFLCFGFYPYIHNEEIAYNNCKIYIDRIQSSKYKKGGSHAHWCTILAS